MLDEAGYDPVYKVLDKLGLPRTFPDFTTASYTNGSVFNVARTLALAQRYLSADILIQLSLEPDPVVDRASLFVISRRYSAYRSRPGFTRENKWCECARQTRTRLSVRSRGITVVRLRESYNFPRVSNPKHRNLPIFIDVKRYKRTRDASFAGFPCVFRKYANR